MEAPSIVSKSGDVLNPGSLWDRALTAFRPEFNDIYFDHRYMSLYLTSEDRAQAFLWQNGDNRFFFPYIVRPIPGHSALFDLETAYGYGGPLSTTEDSEFLADAWTAFHQCAEKAGIVVGFVRFHPLLQNQRFALPDQPLQLIKDRATVTINLQNTEDQLLSSYTGDIAYQIRKANQNDVRIESDSTMESLLDFARLYQERMTEIEAADEYFFGESYFKRIAELGRERFKVYRAFVGNETIGGALALLSERWAHYHLAASPKRYSKFASSKLLVHALIKEQRGGARQRLHLGGGRTNQPNDALYQFKQRFSQDEVDFYFGKWIINPTAYEQLCAQWEKQHPDLAPQYQNYVQRYRIGAVKAA